MTLTPEQKNVGWIEWSGGECPIKDKRTRIEVLWSDGAIEGGGKWSVQNLWDLDESRENIAAYRIIEAHGADAEPARPTPFPTGYDDLVFDADGWSQTIIVDGKRPEWLQDNDRISGNTRASPWPAGMFGGELAIRVRRREPKRETVKGYIVQWGGFAETPVTYDLIDGKPDLSTLKIGGEA